MRFLVIAAASAILLAPVSTPASARSGVSLNSGQTAELSAATVKKEKVEYMRSAAGPEPTIKKPRKKKTAKKQP